MERGPADQEQLGAQTRRAADGGLAQVQRAQFGVFSRQQALTAGVAAPTVDGRVTIGRYQRLLPGVMAEAGTPDSWEVRAMAALLWVGDEALLARGSAARVLDLPVPRAVGADLHLLVRTRCFDTRPGIAVHRTKRLGGFDRRTVGPLAVTTAARTICDLAGDIGPTALRRLVAAAVRDGQTDAAELRAMLRRLGRIRGAVALRTIVDELSPLDAQCNSEFESLYLRMARSHGIEPTAMNHPTRDANGGRRYLDAVYLPERVWVELDSARFHGTLLDRNDDAIRTAAIERAGEWAEPLRFTWTDVTERGGDVAAQVRAALAAARTNVD